jgi:hypothetical protein
MDLKPLVIALRDEIRQDAFHPAVVQALNDV